MVALILMGNFVVITIWRMHRGRVDGLDNYVNHLTKLLQEISWSTLATNQYPIQGGVGWGYYESFDPIGNLARK